MSDDAKDKVEKSGEQHTKVPEVIRELAGAAQEGAKQLVLIMRKSLEGKPVVTNPGQEGFSIGFGEKPGDKQEAKPGAKDPTDKSPAPGDKKQPDVPAAVPTETDKSDGSPQEAGKEKTERTPKGESGEKPADKNQPKSEAKPDDKPPLDTNKKASDKGSPQLDSKSDGKSDSSKKPGDASPSPQPVTDGSTTQQPPTHIDYPNKGSRDIEYDPRTGKAIKMSFSDPEHNFKDTWERLPGTGLWYQRDADGTLTGKLFAGDVTVSTGGDVKYKPMGDADSKIETADGQKVRETTAGARIKEEGNPHEINYPNNTRAEVSYDEKGKPSEVKLPDGTHLVKKDDVWVAMDEHGKPVEGLVFADVRVDRDGTIAVTDIGQNKLQINGDGSQSAINSDGSKLEYDQEGRVHSITYPAPKHDSMAFEYNDPSRPNQPTSIDYSNGKRWDLQKDGSWVDQSTGETWQGKVKVEADGSFSYQAKGSSEIITRYATGSRTTTDGASHKVETLNGATVTYDGNKVAKVDYPNGQSRTFSHYNKDGQPKEVTYENTKTGAKETWKKEGDHWTEYDKDGKPGRSWNGDIEVDKESGAYIYHDANSTKFVEELPNGSVLTSTDGKHITEVKAANGEVKSFEWDDKIGVKSYTDKSGSWSTEDGTHWTSEDGKKRAETITVDGDGTISRNNGKAETYENTDSTKMVQDKNGAKVLYDKDGHLTETIDANNRVYRYGYDDKGDVDSVTDPEGKTWNTSNGYEWNSADGKEKWEGTVKVDQRDGSLTYSDRKAMSETTMRVDSSKTVTDQNPESSTYGKTVTTDKDGKTKVDVPPVDRNEMAKSSEAFYEAAHGWTGADPKAMQDQLDGKTEAERYAMDQWYQEKYGISLSEEIDARLEGADKVKAQNMLSHKDGVDDNAGFVKENLAEIDALNYDQKSEKRAIEKELRLKKSSMNAEDIAAMNAEYSKNDPTHRTAIDAILEDPNISQATKDAIAIYAKGKENVTDADYKKIADSALENKNLDSFEEAMANMSPEARRQFKKDGGDEKVYEAFDHYIDHTDFENAKDYMNYGELNVAQAIYQNTGNFKDDVSAIETAIETMSPAARQRFEDGQKIAGEHGDDFDPSTLPPDQQEAYLYYKDTEAALKGAGNATEVQKWEAMIPYGESALFTDAANHRGSVSDDSVETIITDINRMTQQDWDRLKKDPDFRKNLEEIYGAYLSDSEMARVKDTLDKKQAAPTYEESKPAGKLPILEAIGEAGTSTKKLIEAIANMTPQEQEDYRNNKDGIKDVIQAIISINPNLKEAGTHLTDKIERGEAPKEDIVTEMYKAANADTDVDEGAIVAKIQQAFKDDPELRNRINNPQTDADKELAAQFEKAGKAAAGSWDYDKYIKPLVENGSLDAATVKDLYSGTFDDDELGFYQSLENMTEDERQKIAKDPDTYLGFLNAEEREVALKVITQGGKMASEDMIRAYQLGAGTMEQPIKDLLASMTPEQIEQMKRDYAQKYDSDLTADVMSELGGEDARDAKKMMARPKSSGEEFNDALEEYGTTRGSGRGADEYSGTGVMVDNAVTQYSKAMGDYAAVYEKMPPEVQKKYQEQLQETLKSHRDFKAAMADFAVNAVVMAASLAGAVPTGGASLAALAAVGAAGGALKVAVKSAMMGGDYDWDSEAAADFASGAVDAAAATIGPAGAAGLGENVAAKTAATLAKSAELMAKDASVTALEQDVKTAVTEAIKSGAKEISEETLASIAKKYAAAGAEAQFETALKKSIEQEIAEAAKVTAAKVAGDYGKAMAYGSAGGAVSGATGAALKADNDKSLMDNVGDIAKGAASGAKSGAMAATIFHTVSLGAGAIKDAIPADAVSHTASPKAPDTAPKPGPEAAPTNPDAASKTPDTPSGDAKIDPTKRIYYEKGLPKAEGTGGDTPAKAPDTVPETTPDASPTNPDAANKPDTPAGGGNADKPAPIDGPGKPRRDAPGKLLRKKPGAAAEPPKPVAPTPSPLPAPQSPKPTTDSSSSADSADAYVPDPDNPFFTRDDIPALRALEPTPVSDTEIDLEAVYSTQKDIAVVDPSTADTRIDIPALTPEAGFKKPEVGGQGGKVPKEIAQAPPTPKPAEVIDPGPKPLSDTADAGADVIPDGVSPGTIPDIFLKEGAAPERMVVTATDPAAVLKEDSVGISPDATTALYEDALTGIFKKAKATGDVSSTTTSEIPVDTTGNASVVTTSETTTDTTNDVATDVTNETTIDTSDDITSTTDNDAATGTFNKTSAETNPDNPVVTGGSSKSPTVDSPTSKLPGDAVAKSDVVKTTGDGPGKPRQDAPGKLLRKKPTDTAEPQKPVAPTPSPLPAPQSPKPTTDSSSSADSADAYVPDPDNPFFTRDDIPALRALEPTPVSDTEIDLEAVYSTQKDIAVVDPSTADTRIDIPALTPEAGFKKPEVGGQGGKVPKEIAQAPPTPKPAEVIDPGPKPLSDTADAGADVIPDGVSPGTIPDIFLKEGGGGGDNGDVTQLIKLPKAQRPNRGELPEDLARKIEAAESTPFPKPEIGAKPKIDFQADYGLNGQYGSRVEMEINGTKVDMSRPGTEGYYYGHKLSAKDAPAGNKVHIEAANAEELAKMQAVLIPSLENDPALKDLIANWKTIDPRLTVADGKWGVPEETLGSVGAPKYEVKPGDRGQDAKAFTIYVKDKRVADAVAKRLDEILAQYPEFQDKDIIPTGNSDTVVGDTNRVCIVKDYLPKAADSTADHPQAQIDDAIADSIKNDQALAARARKNGVSVLKQLETEIGLKPDTLHENDDGKIVVDLPAQKDEDFKQYGDSVYLDESKAIRAFGSMTARPAIYAIYKHYGYDPKDF